MAFAESSRAAWSPPKGSYARCRHWARSQALRISALRQPSASQDNFVRCVYGHATFADTAETIRGFVRTVRDRGDFIDTATLIEMMASGAKPDGRHIHLSFDDGFANVLEVGGDIFEAARVPYTMFISTDLIGADEATISGYFASMTAYRSPIRTMTWAQVRSISSSLAEIGCHTRTHARLSDISDDPARLADEIAGAKRIIEGHTGRPCTSFAWPYGTMADIDETAIAAIADAGFLINFSAIRGAVHPGTTDMMNVPRHQIEFHWPPHELALWANGYLEK